MLAENASQEFESLADAFENAPLNETMREVKQIGQQSVRDQFTSSSTPEGANWPPRKVEGDGHPLLIDTGDLMQSAVGSGAGRIEAIEGREFKIGTSVRYAKFHQHGTKKMPARKFMGMSERRLLEADEAIADGVMAEVFND